MDLTKPFKKIHYLYYYKQNTLMLNRLQGVNETGLPYGINLTVGPNKTLILLFLTIFESACRLADTYDNFPTKKTPFTGRSIFKNRLLGCLSKKFTV